MIRSHVGLLLATWRELDDGTRARVEDHLTVCAQCRAMRQSFREQDIMLGDLPTVGPTRQWQQAVRAGVGRRPGGWSMRVSRQAGLVAALLVMLVAMSVGTIAVSAHALPGDLLYPIKRTVEQVGLAVIQDESRQMQYRNQLAERRRAEALRILELKRQVSLQFDGVLRSVDDEGWTVGDVPVQLDPWALEAAGLNPGDVVEVNGLATDGELRVLEIRGQEPQQSHPPDEEKPAPTQQGPATAVVTPTVSPTDTKSPTLPTYTPATGANEERPTATSTRTRMPAGRPSETPSATRPGSNAERTATSTPARTRTPASELAPGHSPTYTPRPIRTRPSEKPTKTHTNVASTPVRTPTPTHDKPNIGTTPLPTFTPTPEKPAIGTTPPSNDAPTPTPPPTATPDESDDDAMQGTGVLPTPTHPSRD